MRHDEYVPLPWHETYPGTPDTTAAPGKFRTQVAEYAGETSVSGSCDDGIRYVHVEYPFEAERDEARRWAGIMYNRALKAERERDRLHGLLKAWGDVCFCGEPQDPNDLYCPKCQRSL